MCFNFVFTVIVVIQRFIQRVKSLYFECVFENSNLWKLNNVRKTLCGDVLLSYTSTSNFLRLFLCMSILYQFSEAFFLFYARLKFPFPHLVLSSVYHFWFGRLRFESKPEVELMTHSYQFAQLCMDTRGIGSTMDGS